MATKASTLLRAALVSAAAATEASLASRAAAAAATKATEASLASRAAPAAASRAAAMASRAACAAAVAADVARVATPSLDLKSHQRRSNYDFLNSPHYKGLPDDSNTPTDKDLESDEALWALYERWCKAFNKKRDHAEMVRRFKISRYNAKEVHRVNTYVPADPKKAAIWLKKTKKAKLLISKGKDVSHFAECYLPMMLGTLADGGDTYLRVCDYDLLKDLEKKEACHAPTDVIVE